MLFEYLAAVIIFMLVIVAMACGLWLNKRPLSKGCQGASQCKKRRDSCHCDGRES